MINDHLSVIMTVPKYRKLKTIDNNIKKNLLVTEICVKSSYHGVDKSELKSENCRLGRFLKQLPTYLQVLMRANGILYIGTSIIIEIPFHNSIFCYFYLNALNFWVVHILVSDSIKKSLIHILNQSDKLISTF